MRQIVHRNAFTLIEVLVVLIILSILAAMVTTAVSGVRTTAREARTKRIISVVDSVISEHYEQLRYRPLPVEIPDLYNFSPSGGVIGYEVLSDETARVRLMMLRDMQRMELPDRFTDITNQPALIAAAANRVKEVGGEIVASRADKAERQLFRVAWYDTTQSAENIPAKLSAYRSRLSGRQTVEHQGAECLYMILSTSFVGGQPAIGAIPDSNIGDTDDDGMMEVLDGWGQPLQFVRWPVGFTPSVSGVPPNIDFELSMDVERPDDFDLFRSDYAYVAAKGPAWATDAKNQNTDATNPNAKHRPWSMKPLIFSSGEDEESGIALNPGDQVGLPNATFAYTASDWNWPVDTAHYGVEAAGRGSDPLPYVDPYLRRFIELNGDGKRLPGELLGNSPAQWNQSSEQATDNLTNYQLQVSP
ncbi:type II secretion system GspH family protein [bacterium]|nr:type II secretion system GspH family protein [bacterium]